MQQMYQRSVLIDWLRVRGLGLDRKVIGWLEEMLFAGSCIWFNFFLTFFFSGMTGHSCNEQIQEMQVGVRFVASVLATNGQVDGGEVTLEGSSWGKHLAFIRHRSQEQAGRWWWSLYTIEKSLIPPTSAPRMRTSTHRACLMYALNINHVVFHDMDI